MGSYEFEALLTYVTQLYDNIYGTIMDYSTQIAVSNLSMHLKNKNS